MEAKMAGIFLPYIQAGFAGFSLILLTLVFWMVKKLLEVIGNNNKVITSNTDTINTLITQSRDEMGVLTKINDRLLLRPCMLPEERRSAVR